MSFRYTGTPSRVMMIRSRTSSILVNWPGLRSRNRRSASSTSPSGMFWFSVRRTWVTRSTERLSPVIFSRDRSTWI